MSPMSLMNPVSLVMGPVSPSESNESDEFSESGEFNEFSESVPNILGFMEWGCRKMGVPNFL